jgi:hypothetical protein
MKTRLVLVRYKVQPGRVAENETAIFQVFDQLERERPAGLHYGTFKGSDGESFFHFALSETVDGSSPLNGLSAFKAFSAGVRERCVEPPVLVELSEVRSYQLFTDRASQSREPDRDA